MSFCLNCHTSLIFTAKFLLRSSFFHGIIEKFFENPELQAQQAYGTIYFVVLTTNYITL
jgi:hypothetical protein